MLVRPLKHERPGIGHQRGVKAGRHFRREWRPSFARQTKHHFSRGYGMRIDPVHVRERASANMVIDTDQETVFQSFQPGAVDTVALQNNCGFVIPADVVRLQNLVGKG